MPETTPQSQTEIAVTVSGNEFRFDLPVKYIKALLTLARGRGSADMSPNFEAMLYQFDKDWSGMMPEDPEERIIMILNEANAMNLATAFRLVAHQKTYRYRDMGFVDSVALDLQRRVWDALTMKVIKEPFLTLTDLRELQGDDLDPNLQAAFNTIELMAFLINRICCMSPYPYGVEPGEKISSETGHEMWRIALQSLDMIRE